MFVLALRLLHTRSPLSADSIVLRAPARTYSETLIWRVWDTLTDELAGPHVLLVVDAMASVECLDEDIGTLLRHLALARLSGWYVLTVIRRQSSI